MRLIDADALILNTILNPLHAPYITKQDVQNAPSMELKRGRWVFSKRKGLFDCADCGISSHYQYNFCPHCGAKMEGDADETD